MGFECGSLGTTPTVSVCPPLQRSSGQQVPSRPALVVCPSGLAPGGSHQRGGGLLHYAVWSALWKGQLSPVAHLHSCVLCGECVHHPAPEGQSTPPFKVAAHVLSTSTLWDQFLLKHSYYFFYLTNT